MADEMKRIPPTTDQAPPTTDHRPKEPPTTDLKNHRPPTNGCEKTDHRPEQQPTTDQITTVKPPTIDHIANMHYLLRDFSAIAILWYRVPHMNGAGLNLPGKTRVIKIDRLQS